MEIKFNSAVVIDLKTVRVSYTLDGVEFVVQWDIDEYSFDLDHNNVKCGDYNVSERVIQAIQSGECDSNNDLELYLFIRDTVSSQQCMELVRDSIKIIEVQLSDYDDSTVLVKAGICIKDSVVFHVQTTYGEYRPSLGCWITIDGSDGEINKDEYAPFDFDDIIQSAEESIARQFTEYSGYTITYHEGKMQVLDRNRNYYNKDTSPYTNRFELLGSFDSEYEAMEFIDNM